MIMTIDYGKDTNGICYDIYTYIKIDDMIITLEDNIMNERKITYGIV